MCTPLVVQRPVPHALLVVEGLFYVVGLVLDGATELCCRPAPYNVDEAVLTGAVVYMVGTGAYEGADTHRTAPTRPAHSRPHLPFRWLLHRAAEGVYLGLYGLSEFGVDGGPRLHCGGVSEVGSHGLETVPCGVGEEDTSASRQVFGLGGGEVVPSGHHGTGTPLGLLLRGAPPREELCPLVATGPRRRDVPLAVFWFHWYYPIGAELCILPLTEEGTPGLPFPAEGRLGGKCLAVDGVHRPLSGRPLRRHVGR